MAVRAATLSLAMTLCLPHAGSAQIAGVDTVVEQFLKEETAAGFAVAVMKGDEILHMKGYGFADLEHRAPATEHTVFKLASLSKQFTAMAVMILVERGAVELGAPITEYFPEFPASGHVPTVGQLINHTSGLDFQEQWSAIMPPASASVHETRDLRPATLAKLFQERRFDFAPGERFRYNNNAYDLAGLLIERVGGLSYPDFLQKHIWDPLEMRDTYFMDAARIIRNRAGGYTLRDEAIVHAPFANLHRLYASGALGTSISDMLKWQRALHGSRLVGPATTKKMMTAGRLNDGTPIPYGYGLFLTNMSGKAKIEHYGNIGGTRAQLAYYPSEQLTVAIMANTNPLRTDVLESRIARVVLGMPEPAITEVPVPPAQLQTYAATYLVTDAKISHRSVPTEITFKDGALYAGRFRLIHTGGNIFVPVGDPYHHYTFAVRDGAAVALTVERETRLIADARRVPPDQLVAAPAFR
jgi:CubicO group peptidase (beta-lactamase class C family)